MKTATEILDLHAQAIGEHFENVQIMVTWNEGGITKSCFRGVGNWHARQGMAHEFINMDIAQENAKQIASELQYKPDSGDDWKQVS
jgi:hypothetical protein